MWVVVHFVEESNVEVVPCSWFDGDSCWWPQHTTSDKIKKLVEKEIAPGSKSCTWAKYKARTMGKDYYDSLLTARNSCNQAQYTSDLASDSNSGKRKRTLKRRRISSSSDEDDPAAVTPASVVCSSPGLLIPSFPESSNEPNQLFHSSTPKCVESTERGDNNFKKYLVRQINLIKMRLNKIDETQETILSLLQEREGAVGPLPVAPTPQQPDIIINIKNQLPITTDEKMDIVEDELSTKEKMEEMARYLSTRGGNTIPEIVRRILKSTMTDQFAANYSWIGFKKKKVFSSLHLKEAIFSGVRLNSRTSSASDAEIEDVIKTWLKYAKARFQAREKKGNVN